MCITIRSTLLCSRCLTSGAIQLDWLNVLPRVTRGDVLPQPQNLPQSRGPVWPVWGCYLPKVLWRLCFAWTILYPRWSGGLEGRPWSCPSDVPGRIAFTLSHHVRRPTPGSHALCSLMFVLSSHPISRPRIQRNLCGIRGCINSRVCCGHSRTPYTCRRVPFSGETRPSAGGGGNWPLDTMPEAGSYEDKAQVAPPSGTRAQESVLW